MSVRGKTHVPHPHTKTVSLKRSHACVPGSDMDLQQDSHGLIRTFTTQNNPVTIATHYIYANQEYVESVSLIISSVFVGFCPNASV